MKKILVPTDFSEQAGYALKVAHDFALKNQAEIFLLNVIEAPVTPSFSVVGMDTYEPLDNIYLIELRNKLKEQMEGIIDDYKNMDVKMSYEITIGNTYSNINSAIAENEVDMVIMGSKGTSGIDEFFIGSNTERIVRHSTRPVLTVKKPIDINKIKNIVFASTFNEDQSKVVKELQKLQKLFKATLHLLYVNTPLVFESTRTVRKLMEDFAFTNNIENYTMNIWNESIEEDGIILFAEDIDADMIAMGTHGRTGFLHLLSGSIAEDIVNHAKRLVWTYNMKK